MRTVLGQFRLYRYEDVIFDKAAWLTDILGYCQIEIAKNRADAIVARHDDVPDSERPSEHIRRVRPGDHIEKLRPETIAALNETLKPVLERYGYI